jgi:hypothetical protein
MSIHDKIEWKVIKRWVDFLLIAYDKIQLSVVINTHILAYYKGTNNLRNQ